MGDIINAQPPHMRENRYNPYWDEAQRHWSYNGVIYADQDALIAAVEADQGAS